LKKWENFKNLLDEKYNWPANYLFKFIIPFPANTIIEERLKDFKLKKKFSKNGKYISISFTKECQNSDEIIEIYKNLEDIEGLMAL